MSAVVLDSEALSLLARDRPTPQTLLVTSALRAAFESRRPVLVPAAVLAEQYRGGAHDQIVDSYLGRTGGIAVADTDRTLARAIGNLLARAGMGSEHHVDATVVAAAQLAGGGVILTGDPNDLSTLAEGLTEVVIEPLR